MSYLAYKAGYTFNNPDTDDHAPYFEPTIGTKQGFNNRCRQQPPTKQAAKAKLNQIRTEPAIYDTTPLPTPTQNKSHSLSPSVDIILPHQHHQLHLPTQHFPHHIFRHTKPPKTARWQ